MANDTSDSMVGDNMVNDVGDNMVNDVETKQDHLTVDHIAVDHIKVDNHPLASFREFWKWINRKMIAPWVVLVLTATYAFSHWEASTSAQGVQITQLKADTDAQIKEMKSVLERDHDELHRDLIERLEDIKHSQRELDVKVDQHTVDLQKIKDSLANIQVHDRSEKRK